MRLPLPFTAGLLLCLAVHLPRATAAKIEMVAGLDTPPGAGMQLMEPFGTAIDGDSNLFIIEMMQGNRLLRLDAKGRMTRIAGTGASGAGGDGGPAIQARFNGAHGLVALPDGSVIVADTWNGTLRKMDPKTGLISTLAAFQVPAAEARKSGPYSIALDASGTRAFVTDLTRVHEIDIRADTAKVVAGNGRKGRPEDGATATDAPLVDPRAAAIDRQGNLYILERGGHALRVVDTLGKIRTVVNASGAKGGTGDDGPAISATMNGPKHLCVDLEGRVVIADAENHVVRRYSPKTGLITRIAGTGKPGNAGVGGDPLGCELNRPHGVMTHPETGDLFITDSYNHRVLRLTE